MNAVLIALAVLGGVSEPQEPQLYQVQFRVLHTDTTAPRATQWEGRRVVDAYVVTPVGRPAFFRARGPVATVPRGWPDLPAGFPTVLANSLQIELLPTELRNGAVRLDVEVWVFQSGGRERVFRSTNELAEGTKWRVSVNTEDPTERVWIEATVRRYGEERPR